MEDDDWQEDEQASLSESDHSDTDEYQNFQNELPLDKVLSQHPLFRFKDDDILSVFIKPLETLIKASPNNHTLNTIKDQLKNCLHQEIFGDKDAAQLKAEFQNLNLTHKTICGKLIPINDIYFRCLDCDIHENPAFISLLCTRCFEKSNHDGHRLIIVKKENNSSATCDCGDADVFNPEGFCPDHQPREVDVEDLVKKFPKVIFEKCQSTLKKAFYGVVSAYEIAQKTSNDTIKTAVMSFAEKSMEALLLFCVFCYSEINEAFLPIFGILLKGYFDDKHNILWHDCDDLKAENRLEDIDISNEHKCKCTILGNLLRLGNVMETEGQSKLHKILIECAKEHKFKEFLLLEFTKYLHFLYSQEYTNDEYEDNVNSRLLNMKTQLYSRDALLLQVLDSGHFQNLLSVMRRVVHSASQANHEVYHIMADLRSAILYFLNPKYQCSGRLIKNSDLMLDLLDVLMNFQIKFLYEGKIHIGLYEHKVEYRSINCGLMIEKVISQTLESGIKLICEYPANEKIPLAKKFGSKWHENFLISREVLDDEMRNGFVTFHTGLERIFCYFIRNYTQETSLPNLEKFFKEALPDAKPSEVAEKVLEGTLRTLGMVRYLHMVHNFKTGQLWYVYYFFNNVFFEMDIVSAQLMAMMINPDNLFDVFVKNFFSYSTDLQDFFKNPTIINTGDYFKQRLSVLEDFLNFLIYLMNDEICGLNLELKDAHSFHENVKVDSRYKRIVEKVVINLLLGHYWTDLPHLKDVLKDVMKEQHEVDEIIPKITILDEKNHKIRLKDQYEQELDPYMFYRTPYIQRDILNNFGSKQKKDEKSDLISGKFYTDLPQYLKVIQKNIYQSHLPNFLRLFLSKFIKETSPLVRPALKLVLLNLQVVSESLSSVSSANELLKKRVQENYFDSEFSNTLHEILQKDGLKDCELIIEKIKDLIKTLMTKMHQRQTVETETMHVEEIEDQEARKKKLAKEKMQKMKEEFVKKRATFATKNTDLISQSTECEESKTEGSQLFDHTLTCQYCLDKINDETEEHGAPIYVAFTNNFYDTEQQSTFKEQDYSALTKSNWWPVVSSCHHSYHKKCFDSLYKNSMSPQETSKKLLSNKYETYCSLCKGLCNGFLCMNESTTFTPHVKEVSEQEKEKYSELYSSFAVKPKQILLDLRKRMTKLCPSIMEEEAAEEPWLTEEVFKRAYAYYLESIHLHTQSDALEKFFDVFPHFFRGYGDHLKEIEKEETNIPSFFERVWKNNNVQTAESLLQYQAEPLINEIYFEILSEFLIRGPEGKTESVIINKQVAVLLDYLVFKIVQLACFEKGDTPLKPDDILSFYRNSQLLKDIVITELVFPIQKILTACCLNICTILKKPVPNELYNLLCNPGYDTEYLDKLLQLTGVEYSFEKMLEKSLSELGNQTKDILAPINIMLEAKTAGKKTIRPRVVKLAPRTIQLPQNFAEFNTQYYKQKCKLCNDFSKHLMTSICLICGDVMCQAYCDPTNKVFGNLNRHASKYHMGSGLFLDLQHLSKTVISAPLNAIYSGKNVYIDKFGQAIQVFLHERRNILYSLDFKKFTLNEEFIHYLNDITNHHSMGKEVFKVSKTSHYLYNNGNL